MEKHKIKLNGYVVYLIGFLTLLISFYLDIDGSYKPLSGDFRETWPYVILLKNSFMIDPYPYTMHFPLHYYILSKLNFLFNNPDDVRLIFCIFSFITPYLFFLCLKNKYQAKNLNTLFILSSIILFTPSYIYSAVWANDNNLSYMFILIGTLYFYKYFDADNTENKKNINLYCSFLFFALACYSRQYYSVFYAIFLVYFYQKLEFKKFFLLLIYSGLMAIPGLYFLYRFPSLYTNLAFSGNIFNTILGNVVSISIYTFPILLLNFLYSDFKIFNLKKVIYYSAISLSIFILIVFNYNIDSMGANGGIFFIGSKLIFGNYFLFYLLFLINFTVILIIFSDKYDLLILFSILIVISGFITLQKYFEPLFFIFFFLFSKSEFKEIFINNKKIALYLVVYHFIYYLTAVSDVMYKISFI
tara:strand:+ start:1284 stop:2528 length:1245 start_codon:yes stop_codon:yes gene_type:complete